MHITLRRACEDSMHRIISTPVYKEILAIRNDTWPGRKERTLYIHLSPLQKLEAAHKERYPEAPKIETIRPGLFAPWDTLIKTAIPPTETARQAHNRALEQAEGDPLHRCIYTDGSEIDGEVGAAAYMHRGKNHQQRYLGPNTVASVYSAELTAISMALDTAIKEAPPPLPIGIPSQISKLTIFSDSQAAIQAVAKPGGKSGQTLRWGIWVRARIARRKGVSTTLHWVEAHVGVPGNERADLLAKQATGWRAKDDDSGLRAPLTERAALYISAARRGEREVAKQAWQRAWSAGGTGGALRRILPDIGKRSLDLYKGTTKALSAIIVQMRTGKIALKAYLHAINRAPDRLCSCGQPQTVKHVLLECPNFSNLRHRIWGDHVITCADKMLQSHATTAAKYLLQTGLLGQFHGGQGTDPAGVGARPLLPSTVGEDG